MDKTLQSMFAELAGLEFQSLAVDPASELAGSLVRAAARMAHHLATGRMLPVHTTQLADLAQCRDILKFLHEYAERCVRLRTAVRASAARFQDIAICSLGLACLARTLLTKYGFIATRAEGRKTCPFDLSTHSLEAVALLLENGFARYAEPGRLRHEGRCLLPWERGRSRMILHKDYDVGFNHDLAFYPRRGDLKRLSGVLAQRVRNLDELITGARRVLFVLDAPSPVSASDAERLRAAVRGRYGVEGMLLVLAPGAENAFHRAGNVCRATYVPPFAGYQWYCEAHYMTAEGVRFERAVVGHVLRCLQEMGPGDDRAAGAAGEEA